MESRERFDPFGAVVCEMQPDDAAILLVPGATHKARRVGAVNEAHSAVMAQEQMVGHLSDCRPPGISVTPDGEQELMLRRRESRFTGLLLAPALEMAQPRP